VTDGGLPILSRDGIRVDRHGAGHEAAVRLLLSARGLCVLVDLPAADVRRLAAGLDEAADSSMTGIVPVWVPTGDDDRLAVLTAGVAPPTAREVADELRAAVDTVGEGDAGP